MKLLCYILIFILCSACTATKEKSAKKHSSREHIINIKSKVTGIDTEDVLIGSMVRTYVFGDYWIIADHSAPGEKVHVFNKNTFRYLTSLGNAGQGPSEISVLGGIAWNGVERDLYVTDNGQYKVLCYNLDSLLTDSLYTPWIRMKLQANVIPDDYVYVNDTLSYGLFVLIDPSSFRQTGGRWNLKTGDIKLIDYVHPQDEKKRVVFSASTKHNTLVECNRRYDLITLYDLDGELRCNVYGPYWNSKGDRKMHFSHVTICDDKIVASYVGEDWRNNDGARILHVFNMSGDYLVTLDVGYKINHFCYDEENDRLIMNLDDEMQFAYIDLEDIL